jgi:hypothetical protein
MNWIVRSFVFLSVALIATAAPAALVNFSYLQADSATGLGTIAPFVYDDGGGPISFTATAMPAAVVHNPVPGSTPAGFVGAQSAQGGNSNEGNTVVGLTWTGSAIATGTRGANVYTMAIPLRFVPKQTQVPDINDYTWNVVYGDSPANGIDTVAPGNGPRFAMWYSRDTVDETPDVETPNTFQRYTQVNNAFGVGPNTYTNTDLTTTPIKDATDSGAPAGTDAAGRDLAFYFGWRDQNAPTAGAILIDDFTVGGLLDADVTTLRLVPEPSTFVLGACAAVALGYCGWRRRK